MTEPARLVWKIDESVAVTIIEADARSSSRMPGTGVAGSFLTDSGTGCQAVRLGGASHREGSAQAAENPGKLGRRRESVDLTRNGVRMIEVRHLTKRFGRAVAVEDLTFRIEAHDIVGFLGPNGAGKTTTLRLLTGLLWPTGGELRVAGYDVMRHPVEVKRRVGYLPEHDALYREMRVHEYLTYRARLKGVPSREVRRRVQEVLTLCEIAEVRRAPMGTLSKGYCRRVGLADCLLHAPEVLLLDEPTLGLDPGQVCRFRSLMHDLAERHTVLLSTHLLPEVEQICRHVLILNRGRLVAAGETRRVLASAGRRTVVAEIRGDPAGVADGLRTLPHIEEVEMRSAGDGWVRSVCLCAAGSDPREAIAALAATRGWALRELTAEHHSLEDVFLALTRPREQTRGLQASSSGATPCVPSSSSGAEK